MTITRLLLVLSLATSACTTILSSADDSRDADKGSTPTPTPTPTPAFTECVGTTPAHVTFNAFWSTFDRRYAVFDRRLHGTTWAAIGEAGCARIVPGITDSALYDVLLDMAKQLDDGHVTLTADALGRDEDAEVTMYPYYDEVYGLEDLIEAKYLDDGFTTAAEDEISWGTIGNLGYISITSMEELSASGDEDDDIAAARAAMSKAMAALAGVDGIIVDIRANEGGWDSVSLEIARWFGGARRVAWSKQVRAGAAHDAFTAPVPTYVEAMRPGGFTGPVVLLTSGGTYSAAETFALAMRVRDHVAIIGERSAGFFSDMIDGTLPNGWTFTYSGERYTAADGMIYEAGGVPVATAVNLDVAKLAKGVDVMLDAAIVALP